MKYLRDIFNGFWSLAAGMAVTFRYMLKKPVTVLYPKQQIVTPGFRGPIAFTHDEVDDSHNCIACNACVRACPSRCMHLEITKNPKGERVLTDFKVDHSLCSLCSTCIEVCPTDALKHDFRGYDEVAVTRQSMVHDLLEPFRSGGVDVNQPIRTPAQKKAEREKSKGTTP